MTERAAPGRAGPLPTRRGLLSGIVTVTTGTALERVLGYLRDVGLAAFFGLGASLDAFNVALSVPLLLNSLFPGPGGARISSLFIPLYTEYRERHGLESARRLARAVSNLLFLGLLVAAAGMILFPGAVVKVVAPGFSGEAAVATARVLRLVGGVLVLWGLAGFCRAFLLAHERFATPTVAQVMSNLFLVLFVYTAATRFGVEGVAVATVISGFLLLAIQAPRVVQSGFAPGRDIEWRHPGLRRFGILLVPVVFGMGVGQINELVNRIMASTLAAGSVSALTYANRIRALPMELFLVGVNQATFPRLCREYTRAGVEGVRDMALFTLRITAAVALPAVVGILVLREPIARITFGYGSVGDRGAGIIAGALGCYIVGLLPTALSSPLAGIFYAMQDTRTPTIISAISLGSNVVLNLCLIGVLGLNGLALASSLAALIYTVLTVIVLRRRLGGIGGRETADAYLRPLLASGIMGLACGLLFHFLAHHVPVAGRPGLALALATTITAGVVVYLAAAWALRVRGTRLAWQMVRERLGRPRP